MAEPRLGNTIPLLKKIAQVCLAHAETFTHSTRITYRQLEATFTNIMEMTKELVQMYAEGAVIENEAELKRLAEEKEKLIQDAVNKAK